jgi:hypothetical protein
MRRLFWLGLGVSLGVVIMRRVSKIAERLTPKGAVDTLGSSLIDLAHGIGDFAGEVRASMSSRERQLREGTGLETLRGGRSANGQSSRRSDR